MTTGGPAWSPEDDDADLVHLFEAYTSHHEPDRARINARLATGRRDWRRSRLRTRVAGGVLAAAMAAAVAVVLVTLDGPNGDAIVVVASQPPTPDAASTIDAIATPVPTTVATQTPVPSSAPVAVPTTTGSPVAASTSPSPSAVASTPPAVSSSGPVSVTALPEMLSLSGDGYVDWVVTGARGDGAQVRMEDGAGALERPVATTPATAVQAESPVELAWTGGSPEQSRDGNREWWSAPAEREVFSVRVGPQDRAGELAVYAGGSAQVTVTVVVDGLPAYTVLLPATDQGSGGVVVVRLDAEARGRGVIVRLGAAPGTGSVALGAVTLR